MRCILCGFPTELDDVVVMAPAVQLTLCLRCFDRETNATRPMPAWMRRDVAAVVNAAQ